MALVSSMSLKTGQGPHFTNLHRWGLDKSSSCKYRQQQTMKHMIDVCPLTKCWLRSLHSVDTDALSWL